MKKTPRIISVILLVLSVCFLFVTSACGSNSGNKKEEEEMTLYKNPYTINVATTGNNSNDGSENNPLSDISVALEKAKALTSAQVEKNDAVRIFIKEGTYSLENTIEITSSLPCGKKLVIEGEGMDKVSIDGGKKVTANWEVADAAKNIYKCKLENVNSFRQLYVNGELAIRSRYPNDTGDVNADNLPIQWMEEQKLIGIPSYVADDISMDAIKGAELFFVQEWTQSIGHIALSREPIFIDDYLCFDLENADNNKFLFTRSAPSRQQNGRNKCWFENKLEFLTEENEWYYDEANSELYYKPIADTDINDVEVFVPQMEKLLTIIGTAKKPVENIALKGLTLKDTNWTYATENDYFDFQAGMFRLADGSNGKAPACIYTRFAENIVIDQVQVKNTGAYGIDINVGTKDLSLTNSIVKNCATSGINLGYYGERTDYATPLGNGYIASTTEEITERIVIKNNFVENIGTSYKGGSTGIVGGYVRYVDIVHNTIKDVAYSGIAIGWGWEADNTINQNINISYNSITNVMNHLPYDGAPIYLLGKQVASLEGSTISENYIEVENGLGGIYFDNSSSFYTLNNNVIKGKGLLGLIDLHDWNYFLRNIKITNTYCSTGEIFVHAYWQNTATKPWADLNQGKTPPSLVSRGVSFDKEIPSFVDGKWSEPAQKIVDAAGARELASK